jgi:acetylornithine deacetylase/succinyl-diaminopimelate desuccinylase-like protein
VTQTLDTKLSRLQGWVEANLDQHIERLRRMVRQPSISPTGQGMEEGAQLTADLLREIGCQRVEIVPTSGFPVVYGEWQAGQPHTLLIYSEYDVMPADEPDWQVPPFEGALVEQPELGRVLMARGARNQKGPLVSILNAVEALVALDGKPPVNLLFVIEGEEELGSRHLPEFIKGYSPCLKQADAMLAPHTHLSSYGEGVLWAGSKGIITLEIEASGEKWGRGPLTADAHSCYKAFVDSPAWRLVQALSTLVTVDGNRVLVEGFYDAVLKPSPADEALLTPMLGRFNPDFLEMKIPRFIEDVEGMELMRRFFYSPTLNINGLVAGYTGQGIKTLLPARATAKLDLRYVPNQSADDLIKKLRVHLDQKGFTDVELRVLGQSNWSATPLDAPIVRAAMAAYRRMGRQPQVWPRNPGSIPFWIFNSEPLSLPFVSAGLGHAVRSHAPNEYIVIDGNKKVLGLAGFEVSLAAILYEFADAAAKAV